MQRTYLKQGLTLLVGVITLLLVSPLVHAAETGANTAAISQGFSLRGQAIPGTIVSFVDDKEGGVVGVANVDNVEKLVGVIGSEQLLELSGEGKQTQVVTNGSVLTLVSDINGEVMLGDKITASPLNGIGMKATENVRVVGTAQHDFSQAKQISQRQITDVHGGDRTVRIGLIKVQVAVAYYQMPEKKFSILPESIQRLASEVVGRSVDPIRVLVALVLLAAGFGGVAILLYSSVRSSIISIGRNPLAARAVHKSLIEVGLTTFGVLLLTLIAVYLVLVI